MNKLRPVRNAASQLGDIIRRQRELNRLSLRQFAAMAGISNPYLSQIERGLRAPSAEVVDAIARSLQTNAAELYEKAGIDADDGDDGRAKLQALLDADGALSQRQRRILMDVYDALVAAGPTPLASRRRKRPGRRSGE